jgi:hypothetical protein
MGRVQCKTTVRELHGRMTWDKLRPMIEVPVSKGKYTALVDDEDAELVLRHKWRAYSGGGGAKVIYAIAHEPMVGGKPRGSVIMHRLIMGAPKGTLVDHRDFNGLNNQKWNLRLATNTQNTVSQRARTGCSSKYKGVSLDKKTGKWKSQISIKGRAKWLGFCESEVVAAQLYDQAAKKLYGEFAVLNFKQDDPQTMGEKG